MPTYNFKNKDTGEIVEKCFSISQRSQFLVDNPNYEQVHIDSSAGIGDAIRMGFRKPDDNFRDVLRRIKSKHRRSTVNTF